MENISRNKYARNNRYGKRRPSYRSSSYSNSRRGGGYNKKGSSINVSQLIAKAVFEDLPSIYVLDHNLLEFDLTKELKRILHTRNIRVQLRFNMRQYHIFFKEKIYWV